MKNTFIILVILSLLQFSTPNVLFAQERGNEELIVETDIDRPGKDYERIILESPTLSLCVDACKKDPKCKAFTFVKPGVQGAKAVCYLKNELSNPVDNTNCISGYKKLSKSIKLIQGTKLPKSNEEVKSVTKPLPDPSAIPINLPIPRPELSSSRLELLQAALEIPEINKQLMDIANSKGMQPSDMVSTTTEGKKAKSTISGGQSIRDLANTDSSQKKMKLSDYDWSGGIQLTPANSVSKFIFWDEDYNGYLPIAQLSLNGISIYPENYALSLKEMYECDCVYLAQGILQIGLFLPNKYEAPYLVEINISRNLVFDSELEFEIFYAPGIARKEKLHLNSDRDKYVGIIKLTGQTYDSDYDKYFINQLLLSIKFPGNCIFNGITISRL